MAEKNPNKLYDDIRNIKSDLETVTNVFKDIEDKIKISLNNANEFGGVISRVFKEQLAGYLLGVINGIKGPINNLIDGDRVPGSLKDLTIFLDSVPLAMTREESSVTELASPVVPKDVKITSPVTDGEEIPQNASYNKGGYNPDIVEENTEEDNTPQDTEELNNDSNAPQQEESQPVELGESLKRKLREGIRGNTKKFLYNFKNLVEGYLENMEGDNLEEKYLNLERDILSCYARYNTIYERTKQYVENGNFADNSYDAFNDLCELYESSPQEMKKFKDKDDVVWNRYVSVFAQYLPKLFKKEMGRELGDTSIRESEEPLKKYQVVRTSDVRSMLDSDTSNIESKVVYEFDDKAEAEELAEELNMDISQQERDLVGTEYSVVEKEVSKYTE